MAIKTMVSLVVGTGKEQKEIAPGEYSKKDLAGMDLDDLAKRGFVVIDPDTKPAKSSDAGEA